MMSATSSETRSECRRLRLLVTYSISSTAAQATRDYLRAFKEYTDYDVSYLHVTHEAIPGFNLNEYDVVLNSYCARHCFDGYVSPAYLEQLRNFRGLKIIAVQDDGDLTSFLHKRIRDLGFDVLLTAVPEDTLAYGYPPEAIPNVRIVRVYTGYLPSGLAEITAGRLPLAKRPIPLGYRGRRLPARYGKLGHLKYEIGKQFKIACEARGIPCDISMQEEDRIYGGDWLKFLGNCRAVLGSESGSNVWDFDGEIDKLHAAMTQDLGRPPSYEEFEPFIRDLELRSNISEVSPRHFEAAATYTPMIMTRGKYSGILEAGKHYVAVEHDFSNIQEVLDQLDDIDFLTEIATETHRVLIDSGNYTYKSLANTVTEIIDDWRKRQTEPLPQRPGIASTVDDTVKPKEAVEFASAWPLHHLLFQARYSAHNAELYEAELVRLCNAYAPAVDHYAKIITSLAKQVLLMLDAQAFVVDTPAAALKEQIADLLEKQFEPSDASSRLAIRQTEEFMQRFCVKNVDLSTIFADEAISADVKHRIDALQQLCTDSFEQIRTINDKLERHTLKFNNLFNGLLLVERNIEFVREISSLPSSSASMPPASRHDLRILEAEIRRFATSDLGEIAKPDPAAEAVISRLRGRMGIKLRIKRYTRRLRRALVRRALIVVERLKIRQ